MLTRISVLHLPTLLKVDAAVSLVAGLVFVLGAGLLASATSLPEGLLLFAGCVFLAVGAFLAVISAPSRLQRRAVMLVVVVSAVWVLASLGVMISDRIVPNALGHALILLQAAVVGCFATLEHLVLRA